MPTEAGGKLHFREGEQKSPKQKPMCREDPEGEGMRHCPDSCGLLVSMTTVLPPHRQLLSGLMAQPLYSGTFPQSVVVAFRPVPHSGATNHKIWGMWPPGNGYRVALDSSHGLGIKP